MTKGQRALSDLTIVLDTLDIDHPEIIQGWIDKIASELAAAVVSAQACKDVRAWGIELASLLPDEREQRFRQLWPKINDVLRLAPR